MHRRPAILPRQARSAVRRGFTLIEAAMVTVIVGVGTLGLLQLLASGTVVNNNAYQTTSSINLANNIREMAQTMSYSGVLALNGQSFSPPRDARNQPIAAFIRSDGSSKWRQTIKVEKVDEDRLTLTVPFTSDSDTARVTVSVTHDGEEHCSLSWLIVETE